jgi:hypothetical protein
MSLQSRALLRAGRWLKNTNINPARWAEGIGHKLGFRTRQKVAPRLIKPGVAPKQAIGEPTIEREIGDIGFERVPNPDYVPAVAGTASEWGDAAPYLSRPLTGLGVTLQGLGYAGTAGAGLLGYKMFSGDGTEPATDANGVKNPKFNEEMAKFRSKFQQDYLGGDKMFSSAKYRAVRDQSPWVRTAIEQIGKEKYVVMKQALADGKISAMDMHSALTDAIAELGDEEVMKQAGTQPYVLPGLASSGQSKRVIVIAPMKGKKGNETSMQALKYAIREEQGQGEQQ